ncbi:sodium-coupled monocarboxylate transporter 1-like isoform X2 [Photinus pyralis]|uniref:sodium-coupled monocarboxylate transporter 1-like isoform X2 n=1 Tax=Photinus pyralis TaxID=7054 RepID=UPI0012675426|nr:sodium-coupled monocarboxylate transporter 1-like isoform X2 [Photinus pyralis]XP_031348595.1 sodium-coupled monocarboxylate transporter 1-like isoform X2 [Photinus pyralis]
MFTIIDSVVFIVVILASLCIGVYFGFWKKTQTTDEYLLGSRTMKVIPIGLSLIASQVSGFTILALPSDSYVFGANSLWMCVAISIVCPLASYIYLPVIMKLKTPSIFGYLELRFNRTVKIMASCIYILQMLLFNPVVAYTPAIAFSQATGINTHIVTSTMCIVCIFYTTIGGFKAVVWTDVLQIGGILASVTAVFGLGVAAVGGFDAVFTKASRGQRFDFNIDPTKRDGFWQVLLGCTTVWVYNVNFYPVAVQKYLSVPALSNAKRVVLLQCLGLVFVHFLSILTGIIIYARYEGCDPIQNGDVDRADQILPYFAVDVSRNIPGLPGIFIAGLFSAALSTLSATFNALAATIHSDLIAPFLSNDVLRRREGHILRSIVVIAGSICIISALFVDRLGSLMAFINGSVGVTCGLFVGLFSLGMVFPMAHSKGALWGIVSGFAVVGTITIVNQWYTLHGITNNFAKPLSVELCETPINITQPSDIHQPEQPFVLFRLSFWYNSVMSALIVTLVGLCVSWCSKNDRPWVDPDLISPIFKFLLVQRDMNGNSLDMYTIASSYDTDKYHFEDSQS